MATLLVVAVEPTVRGPTLTAQGISLSLSGKPEQLHLVDDVGAVTASTEPSGPAFTRCPSVA